MLAWLLWRVCVLLQVALKLEETRKYYDMYNTLDSTRDILRRQVGR